MSDVPPGPASPPTIAHCRRARQCSTLCYRSGCSCECHRVSRLEVEIPECVVVPREVIADAVNALEWVVRVNAFEPQSKLRNMRNRDALEKLRPFLENSPSRRMP